MQNSDHNLEQMQAYYQENHTIDCDQKKGDEAILTSSRRRSTSKREIRKTIQLNASTSNFRALVQQFTGCHTRSANDNKGPITLSFSHPNVYPPDESMIVGPSTMVAAQSVVNRSSYTQKSQAQQQLQDLEDGHKRVQGFHEAPVSSAGMGNPVGPLTIDDFDVDYDVYLQELVPQPPPRDDPLSDNTYVTDFWGHIINDSNA